MFTVITQSCRLQFHQNVSNHGWYDIIRSDVDRPDLGTLDRVVQINGRERMTFQ